MGALAFVVLQSQTDAGQLVADAIADACDGSDLPTDPVARRLRVLKFAARRARRGGSRDEVQPLLPDVIEQAATYTLRLALLEVSVTDRLLLALAHVAHFDAQAIGRLLHKSGTEVRERSNDARNRIQSFAEQSGGAGVDPPFDDVLGRHLRREAARYQPVVTAADVDAARRRHRDADRGRMAAAMAAALVIAAFMAAALGVQAGFASKSAGSAPTRADPLAKPVPESGAPIGLADCQIAPADSSLAYAGWATPQVLGVLGGEAAPGAPVYAVVTRGMAEWVGWRASGGAMYPPPIGRMGCTYDPTTGMASVVGVPMDWKPPSIANGCPVSEISRLGSYRETGGPHGWLVLPAGSARLTARNPGLPLSFRLSPAPKPGQRVTARVQRIDASQATAGKVSSNATFQRPGSAFYDLNVEVPTTGCWVMDVAINGNVVGSAVVSVDGVFARATPRILPIVP